LPVALPHAAWPRPLRVLISKFFGKRSSSSFLIRTLKARARLGLAGRRFASSARVVVLPVPARAWIIRLRPAGAAPAAKIASCSAVGIKLVILAALFLGAVHRLCGILACSRVFHSPNTQPVTFCP